LVSDETRDAYRTIYAQDVTRDGHFFFMGDNYGAVHVFSIEPFERITTFQTDLDCIYDLKVLEDVVICSGMGGVEVLGFDELTGTLEKKEKVWSENTNATAVFNKKLFTAGQSGNLGVIDSATGSLVNTIKNAHQDAIQAVCASSRELLASVGEDGNVNIWDFRSASSSPTKVIQPYLNKLTASDDGAKYLSCCSFRGDWIVTGGGPKTALWHLGSGEPSKVLDLAGASPLNSLSLDGRVLIGGTGGTIHQFQNNGAKISSVPVSSPLVYSIQESSNGYMFAAGNTNVIDVFRNYGHRVHQLIV